VERKYTSQFRDNTQGLASTYNKSDTYHMNTMSAYLQDVFLVAMPNMADPTFSHAVTYICEHNQEGAMGLVINKPMDITIRELFVHLDITTEHDDLASQSVLYGGPLQSERGFVLHQETEQQWQSTLKIKGGMCITTSRDILVEVANKQGPQDFLITLGYAGWTPGQLEQELAESVWLVAPADPKILFQTPVHARWQAAASLLGVDMERVSGDIGHA